MSQNRLITCLLFWCNKLLSRKWHSDFEKTKAYMKFIINCNGTFVGFGFNFWKEGQNIGQFKYILNDGIVALFFPLWWKSILVVKNMTQNEEMSSLIYCRKIVLVI